MRGGPVIARRAASLYAAALCCLPPHALPVPHALPANAVVELSEEQQLVIDAWAVVQRAFVDPNFNGVDWQETRKEYVKKSNSYRSMKAARAGVNATCQGCQQHAWTRPNAVGRAVWAVE